MLTEANFWLPSASTRFRALRTGEPFLFKTHWPDDRMVGGGFFSGYDEFTVREAWQLFGEGNGVADEAALAGAIATYRKQAADPQGVIGCVLLRDPFFTPEDRTVDAPRDFAKNIVRFKGYDLADRPSVDSRWAGLRPGPARRAPGRPAGIQASDARCTAFWPSGVAPPIVTL